MLSGFVLSPGQQPVWRSPKSGSVSAPSPVLQGKRVVVVEDEGLTQMQLGLILRGAGLVVVAKARTGVEGIAAVLRERPDMVLMDIQMPGSVNGLEASRRIIEQYRPCIVMLTAYEEHRAEAMEIGASGYVVKPVDALSLVPMLVAAWRGFESAQ